MKTPQEKAQELVDSFMNIKNIKLSDYSVIYLPAAKQCALITVDEVINYLTTSLDVQTSLIAVNYWKEVKQELENL